ncbi:MAG: helix-turn-helix domain-containing protein, partial [Bdellovibrionales bacterium]|nr:helix-turn-helix domain-containing protein [Bdellovibrionales bacterium]
MDQQDTLGNYIKGERVKRNISLEQVSYATRISMKMLRALEDDDHGSLPAPAFVRGYLQAYAKYVSVDPQDLMLRYQHHLATASNVKRSALRSHYLYVKERYQEKRQLLLIVSLVVALLVSAGTYFVLKGKRERRKAAAQVAALMPAPTPGESTAPSAAAPPQTKAPEAKEAKGTKPPLEPKTEPAPSEAENTPKTYNLSLTATEDV